MEGDGGDVEGMEEREDKRGGREEGGGRLHFCQTHFRLIANVDQSWIYCSFWITGNYCQYHRIDDTKRNSTEMVGNREELKRWQLNRQRTIVIYQLHLCLMVACCTMNCQYHSNPRSFALFFFLANAREAEINNIYFIYSR